MKVALLISFLVLTLFPSITAVGQPTIRDVESYYQKFDYQHTITTARQILLSNDSLPQEQRLEILTLKSASHYSRAEEDSAAVTIESILQLDPHFLLDSMTYSPKIVAFFDSVKKAYAGRMPAQRTVQYPSDSATVPSFQTLPTGLHPDNGTIIRSLLLPGLGHLHEGKTTQGWFLTAAGSAALVSGVYFILHTNAKESDYLAQTNRQQIASAYQTYNNSYKVRNVFLCSYALIWTYTQLDLLLFSNNKIAGTALVHPVVLGPGDLALFTSLQLHLSL